MGVTRDPVGKRWHERHEEQNLVLLAHSNFYFQLVQA
jgi:hypothetical protein